MDLDNSQTICAFSEKEEFVRDPVVEEEVSPEVVHSANSVESTVRFCHSSHEYQPPLTSKKSHVSEFSLKYSAIFHFCLSFFPFCCPAL